MRIGEDSTADKLLQVLQAKGVEVEFRYESSPRFRMKQEEKLINESVKQLGTSVNDMNPLNIFETFVHSNRSFVIGTVNQLGNAEQFYRDVYTEGKKFLDSLMTDSGNENHVPSKDLHIDSVLIRDFGPYGGDPITYPIANRGLVLLRGKSSDGTGADSNGSGKVIVVFTSTKIPLAALVI